MVKRPDKVPGRTITEADVRDPVVKWWKQHYYHHVRMFFRYGVKNGVPDDLFLGPNGIAVWVEFKRPGKRPTQLQTRKINDLRDYGHQAFWSDNAESTIEALKRALNGSLRVPSDNRI